MRFSLLLLSLVLFQGVKLMAQVCAPLPASLVTLPQTSCTSEFIFNGGVQAVIDPVENYTFQWYQGTTAIPGNKLLQTLPALTGVSSGDYAVEITDKVTGCSSVLTVFVPDVLDYPKAEVSLNCNGNNSSATIVTSGFEHPENYTYQWYNGSDVSAGTEIPGKTSSSLTEMAAGSYSVVITNQTSGCKQPITFTTSGTPLNKTDNVKVYTSDVNTCTSESATGRIEVAVNDAGLDGNLFTWYYGTESSPASQLAETSNVLSGVVYNFYNFQMWDPESECSVKMTVWMNYIPQLPQTTFTIVPQSACDPVTPNGSLTVNVLGGQPVVNYTFTAVESPTALPMLIGENSWNNLPEGNYIIETVNQISGCSSIATVTIPANAIIPVIERILVTCPTEENGVGSAKVVHIGSGEISDYEFQWLDAAFIPIEGDGPTVSNLQMGEYLVVAEKPSTGCKGISRFFVVPHPSITVSMFPTDQTSCDPLAPNGSITAIDNAGLQDNEYAWYKGADLMAFGAGPQSTLTNIPAGQYSVEVSHSSCSVMLTALVADARIIPVIAEVAVSSTAICGQTDGSLEVTSISPGQNSDYTFTWYNGEVAIDGATNSTLSGLTMGDYSVVATNKISTCSSEAVAKSISCITALEKGMESGFQIYPNPADREIHFLFTNSASEKATVSITDISGKVLQTIETTGPELTVSRGAMAPGLYIVTLTNGLKTSYSKLVLN